MHLESKGFASVIARLRAAMIEQGKSVHTERWQGVDIKSNPAAEMVELINVHLEVDMRREESLDKWREDIKPNLPWADAHFEERVSGTPMNPGLEWANWPWGKSADKFRRGQKFNHNYMERYWPKQAGLVPYATNTADEWRHAKDLLEDADLMCHHGIRHAYGDLNDVVELLAAEPRTRQAYLPIFFPEDTGIGDGDRKPCSLGYHFMMRSGLMHVFYPMRSVDLVRHFQDDLYLTVRLVLWVLARLRERDKSWNMVRPGTFSMQMSSLHCFINDYIQMRRDHEQSVNDAIARGLS